MYMMDTWFEKFATPNFFESLSLVWEVLSYLQWEHPKTGEVRLPSFNESFPKVEKSIEEGVITHFTRVLSWFEESIRFNGSLPNLEKSFY